MTRLNVVLALALLLSCFWLIRSSNEARGLFVDLEKAQEREKELSVDLDRLTVERRTAATPLVVEGVVRSRLNMFTANPAVTHYVNGAQVGVAAGASASRASASASAPVEDTP